MVYILIELAEIDHEKLVNETEVEERRGMHIVVVSSIKVHDAFPLPLDTESIAAETVLKARAKLKL